MNHNRLPSPFEGRSNSEPEVNNDASQDLIDKFGSQEEFDDFIATSIEALETFRPDLRNNPDLTPEMIVEALDGIADSIYEARKKSEDIADEK